jgi:hypothetical protein
MQLVHGRISRSTMTPMERVSRLQRFVQHIVFHTVASHTLATDPVSAITDCAPVISTKHKEAHTRVHSEVCWPNCSTRLCRALAKSTATSHKVACDKGMGDWWHGNDLVDQLAQVAAR